MISEITQHTSENWGFFSLLLAVIVAEAGFAGWISAQFGKVLNRVDKTGENILNKLEYHERHDDRRFSELGDDIWELRVRLASLVSGDPLSTRRTDQCQDVNRLNFQKKEVSEKI